MPPHVVYSAESDFDAVFRSRGWTNLTATNVGIAETDLLCKAVVATMQRVTHAHRERPLAQVGLLDAAMGHWRVSWFPRCLETQLLPSLPPRTFLRYHGVDVVPRVMEVASREADELLARQPRLTVGLSLVDLTRPGALARSVRGEVIDVLLWHGTLQHLTTIEAFAVLQNFDQVAAVTGARFAVIDNQADDRRNKVNDDEALYAAIRRNGGLRNATHRVDLSQPPFNLAPLEGRPVLVHRKVAGGGSELRYDFCRVFALPFAWPPGTPLVDSATTPTSVH